MQSRSGDQQRDQVGKEGLVAWVVSNCKTESKREDFVQVNDHDTVYSKPVIRREASSTNYLSVCPSSKPESFHRRNKDYYSFFYI